MTAMMLTAIDATSDTVLDITAMTLEQIDRVHGGRTAQRNGFDLICRQCNRPVFLHRNHHRTTYWQHGPGTGRAHLAAGVSKGEGPEHYEAKLAIIAAHRALQGWDVRPEEPFQNGNERVSIDVYAEHTDPVGDHQTPVAWEVQLAHQTHGDFTERTQRIRRVAGVHTNWVTPLDDQLDGHQGIVTDRTASLVVARIYTAPDEAAPPLPPMDLPAFVKGVKGGRYPKLVWSASGENSRFIAFPRASIGNTPTRPKPAHHLGTIEPEDRLCDRPPVTPRPLVRRDRDHNGFAIIRGPEQATFDDFKSAAGVCRDLSMSRQHQCIDCGEPAFDISGLCPKCITARLQHRHPKPA